MMFNYGWGCFRMHTGHIYLILLERDPSLNSFAWDFSSLLNCFCYEELYLLVFQRFVQWMDCWIEGNGWPYYQHAPTTFWCFVLQRSAFTVLFRLYIFLFFCPCWVVPILIAARVCDNLSFDYSNFRSFISLHFSITDLGHAYLLVDLWSFYCSYTYFSFNWVRYAWWLVSHYQADRHVYVHRTESRASFLHD